MCVCLCVCQREREKGGERERERETKEMDPSRKICFSLLSVESLNSFRIIELNTQTFQKKLEKRKQLFCSKLEPSLPVEATERKTN